MSNSFCQACHQERYHSFAIDHPEFKDWPLRRRTRIAFNHASHEIKHFPAEKQKFSCNQCHQLSSNGFQKTLGYEVSCAKCHDTDIQTSWKSGIDFVNLPMIDIEALANAGYKLERWPVVAEGDFDGALPLLAKLLLLSDDETAKALEKLGIDFDFFDVDASDSEQLAAVAKILATFLEFTKELSDQGHNAIEDRLIKVIGRELTSAELAAAIAHLSPENMAAPNLIWLANNKANTTDKAGATVTAGGWLRDDETYSLRYLPAGHDDLFMAAWLNILATATHGPQAKLAETLLISMMSPTAPGMCGSCHSVDRAPKGGLVINWWANQGEDNQDFTVFSHNPHVLQTQLTDCAECHRFAESVDVMATYAQTNPREFASGFHALTKQDCATCHKQGAAGDSCTQCHRYHVRPQPKH
jgi:hypothetical protein